MQTTIGWWVPAQSSEPELLDGTIADQQLLRDNVRDMARANQWLGANRAVLRRVEQWLAALPPDRPLRILDVATGGGDLAVALHRWGKERNRPVQVIASDVSHEVVEVARHTLRRTPVLLIQHDALAMPFADNGVDVVVCTQALHHFSRDAAEQLLHECARVARVGVIMNDLRRSYLAYWGARLLALGPVSPLSRHDGPLSVLRAYTPHEVQAIVQRSGLPAQVRRTRGFRVELEIDKARMNGRAVDRIAEGCTHAPPPD